MPTERTFGKNDEQLNSIHSKNAAIGEIKLKLPLCNRNKSAIKPTYLWENGGVLALSAIFNA